MYGIVGYHYVLFNVKFLCCIVYLLWEYICSFSIAQFARRFISNPLRYLYTGLRIGILAVELLDECSPVDSNDFIGVSEDNSPVLASSFINGETYPTYAHKINEQLWILHSHKMLLNVDKLNELKINRVNLEITHSYFYPKHVTRLGLLRHLRGNEPLDSRIDFQYKLYDTTVYNLRLYLCDRYFLSKLNQTEIYDILRILTDYFSVNHLAYVTTRVFSVSVIPTKNRLLDVLINEVYPIEYHDHLMNEINNSTMFDFLFPQESVL